MKKEAKKECVICNKDIKEEFGKLDGTILNMKDEEKKPQEIYVCSECMKNEDWIEVAIIKGA